MSKSTHNETYGFRFLDTLNGSFCQLFAIGHDYITDKDYHWDGLKRIDGPLLLFQYTVSGFGCVEINREAYKVNPGYAFMVEIPSDHRYYLPETSDLWEFYFILIRPNMIEDQWKDLVKEFGPIPKIPEDHSAILFLQNVFHAASKNHISDGFRASTIVYQFIMELYRFSNAHKKEKNTWPQKIKAAVENMEMNYACLQSLEDIADAVELSKYHFTRTFKKTTGYTPIEYLTKIRMERAIKLLRHTELTIDEIAREIGYSNGSYFIKVFRQWLGFPPGEFRLGRDLASVNQLKFD
ncbi:AraC family transcriptional regulator [Metabacillus bambusae]|uniref:AraC family transcriptional regulator n=1 Tax=Metabacillus bambusae TaxID=2795218 RepID=A0ABS3MW62_9BACI|nr:AraC family transcriptional regulator [Metabacillus bambusae]MBO1510255.1 AraC family transcriptional regulator [Metabacillus bambusae]